MRRQSGRGAVENRVSTRGAHARLTGILLSVALAATGTIAAASPAAASVQTAAADYPTWSQVKAAQKAVASTKRLVAQLEDEVAALQAEVERTEAESKAKGEVYATAQDAYDQAAYTAVQLQDQADDAQAEADVAKHDAWRTLALLAQTGGGDLTADLLTHSGSADSLLYRLGAASKLTERNQEVYDTAVQLQNSAQALGDQAEVARTQLEDLKKKAEKAFEEAQAAASAVADQLAAQRAQQDELRAMLTTLIEKKTTTEKEYKAGLAAQWGSGAAGAISPSGWALPAAGSITDPFGNRYHPIYHSWRLHSGVDIGASYNKPIYAAAAGKVIYAGWFSDLGYFVKIDHGNGIETGYGHIREGGLRVKGRRSRRPRRAHRQGGLDRGLDRAAPAFHDVEARQPDRPGALSAQAGHPDRSIER
jgi:murein DD-endopeptidase MepM/ murein hydrolase activator NlpD